MPTYEYRCTKPNCGREFEVTARMSDPAPLRGPGCMDAGCLIEKKLSRVSAFVKGAGMAKESEKASLRDKALSVKESPQSPAAAIHVKAAEKTPHICTQYCSHHRKAD